MKRWALLFILSLSLCACDSPMNHRTSVEGKADAKSETFSFEDFQLSIEIKWLLGPVGSLSVSNHLLVILKNDQGIPQSLPAGLTLGFYATMPSMGHPLEDPGFFEEVGEGLYINRNIKYNMPGDWKNEVWILDAEFQIKDKVVWDDFF